MRFPLLRRRHGLAGRAAIPYPAHDPSESAATFVPRFRRAEGHVFHEVFHAADGRWMEEHALLGDPPPWIVSAGAARYAFWEAQHRGPDMLRFPVSVPDATRTVTTVIEWLTEHGALHPLPAAQRDVLVDAGRERRRAQGLMVEGFVKLSHEDAWRDEERALAVDGETWEVDPPRMLAVYPGLARVHPRWARARSASKS